jgi:hypothetical protein
LGHRDRQRPDAGWLIHHNNHLALPGQLPENGPQSLLVVGQRTVEQPLTPVSSAVQ